VLLLKPVTQAQRLARALPAELTSAFGPATPSHKAFSLVTALKSAPKTVPTETFNYTRNLLLDFYRPLGRHRAPCIINIHAGSWVSGNRKNDGTQRWLNDHLAQRGYAVASIDYRLAPESKWPARREDLRTAIAYLKSHPAELDIDATRLVLLGRSTGGQLALVAGYPSNDPSIRGIISFYAPSDFRLTWEGATHPENLDHRLNLKRFLGGTPDTATDAYDSASAAILAHPGAPPTLLLHGRLDINVFPREADLLAHKLHAAKVPHAVVTLPWAAHAFDLVYFNSPGSQVSTHAVEWFIEAVTK
jgi:acetyl esterase/lipase